MAVIRRPNTNYIAGAGITIAKADNPGLDAVDVTISGGGGGGGGSALTLPVAQTAHGLTVGNAVRVSGSNTYAKALADSAADAEVAGIVSAVADANDFTLTMAGYLTGLSGLTPGAVYFLSPLTAGLLTATEPSGAGQVSKPLLVATSATAGIVVNWRGVVLAAGAGGYDGAVLALSPDSYWKLTETSGTVLADSGPAAKNLTLAGSGATFGVSTGFPNASTGIDFHGTSYGIINSALTSPVGHAACSVCGFFYVTAMGAFTQPFFCASYTGGHVDPYYTFLLGSDGAGHYRAVIGTTASMVPRDGIGSLPTGAWTHIALVYDGTNLIVYQNGVSAGTVAVTGNIIDAMGSFAIGCIPALNSTTYSPNIRASRVAYWSNLALSAAQVSSLYASR